MTVKTRTAIQADITADITTNGTGDISGQDIRDILADIVDSTSQNVRVVTAAGDITAASDDVVIIVNKATGAATGVDLIASPITGQILTIKDGKGDASTNNITITPDSGNIDGAATLVMSTDYQSVTIVYNGTEWSIL